MNLIDTINVVILSFELIIVNNIINAVYHNYNKMTLWSNLQILN